MGIVQVIGRLLEILTGLMVYFSARRGGRDAVELENARERARIIEEVAAIRRRLRRDPDYAARVRARFQDDAETARRPDS